MSEFDSPNAPIEDHEYPDDPDDSWDDMELIECPECGAEIAEDSPRCPVCGNYITSSTSVWSDKSWGWVLLGLLGTLATVLALALG